MDELRVLVSDPRARTVETDHGTWFVSGLRPDALETLVREADSVEAIEASVPTLAENATLVGVESDGGVAETVRAYRSVAASRELYFFSGGKNGADGTQRAGDLVIGDHFRNVLAQLPVDERTPDSSTIADSLLFRAPIAPGSYVAEIESVGHGEWVRWDGDGDPDRRLTERLLIDREIPPKEAPGAIDAALSDVHSVEDDTLRSLFSGGVDSTLSHTYLGSGVPVLAGGIDSPEYAFELEYVREAARLLGVSGRVIMLEEADVLSHVESGIEALGAPSFALPTTLIAAALEAGDTGTYAMAVGADALFGMDDARDARIASWLGPVITSPLGSFLASHGPDAVSEPLSNVRTIDDQLGRRSADPGAFPQQVVSYVRPELVATFVGEDVVAERCRRLIGYVKRRVPDAGRGGRFTGPVELAHLVSFFGHRIGSRYRQLAHSHGNALITPFETRKLLACSLSIPAERRYVPGIERFHDLEPKYLLKAVLENRLPRYDADRPKGAGILPFVRYRKAGPLEDAFERYPLPSFVPESVRDEVRAESGRQAWTVLTYAIWSDRVLTDPALESVPGTEESTWSW